MRAVASEYAHRKILEERLPGGGKPIWPVDAERSRFRDSMDFFFDGLAEE